MPTETVAEARGLSHRYGGGPAVLDGVDAAALRGTVTALVGANGAGKSTLLRILAGVLEPSSGEVRVLGCSRPAALPPRRARQLRRRVSYVSQEPALDPEMTGAEVLTLLASLYGVGRSERRGRIAELAGSFGLGAHLGRRIDTWSGGQKRRLHLAAGMIHDPELLCLDEPSAGLDPDGREALWTELVRRAVSGRAVVVVTHDLLAVERHAGTVVILEGGKVVASGVPRELVAASPPDLAEVYRRTTGRDVSSLVPRRREGRR